MVNYAHFQVGIDTTSDVRASSIQEHQLSLVAETLDANQQSVIFVQSLA
jgi:hypothetical protein